ncbi:sugar transferase [bacterium]|nr:sugar transferase [bacterium]
MKRKDSMLLLWPVLQASADFVLLTAATILAYLVRFNPPFTSVVPVIYGVPSFSYYVFSALIAAMVWVVLFALRGVYQVRLDPGNLSSEISGALFSYYVGFALLFAFLFFYREFEYSRVVAVLTLFLGTLLLVLARLFYSLLRSALFPVRPLHRALVIGTHAEEIAHSLSSHREAGLKGVSAIVDDPTGSLPDNLPDLVERETVDMVILAYGFERFARARAVIDMLGGHRLHFLFAPGTKAILSRRVAPMTFAGMTMLRLREDPLAGWNGVIKRAFDVLVSLLLLLLLSPVFLVLSLLVALSSKGPIFYKQTRVGIDGRPFPIIKFRTMRTDAEKKSGAVWAKPGDPRVTPLGRFLRRWSLDELPQLWNVLRGEMSLVGPRPERPEFVEQFEEEVPRYLERHRFRSGMTGWAQVNGLRGDVPIADRTRFDLYYVENWSLGFDLWILAKTMTAVLFGKDAY